MRTSIGSIIGALVMLLALPVGLLLVWVPGSRIASRLGPSGEMVRTTGVVVRINTYTSSEGTEVDPVVQFTTRDGRQLTVPIICAPFGCFSKLDLGMSVPIIYPRDDAGGVYVMADTLQGWVNDLLMLLFACLMVIVGGFAVARLYSRLARRSRIPRGGWTGSV